MNTLSRQQPLSSGAAMPMQRIGVVMCSTGREPSSAQQVAHRASTRERKFQVQLVDLKVLHAKIGQLALENDFQKARSSRPACWAHSDDRAHPPPADHALGPVRGH